MLIEIFIFIIGACIGSFLNVCIVRLPEEKSIVTPRSHCVRCKKMIPWYDNIPLISYFVLGGKCRYCKEKISIRYCIVELFTALTFLIFYYQFGLTILLIPYFIMVSGFIVATFVDFEHRIIPDEISIGGIYIGLILSLFIPKMHASYFQAQHYGRIAMWIVIGICIFVHVIEFLIKKKSLDKEILTTFGILGVLLGFDFIVSLITPKMENTKLSSIVPYLMSLDASLVGVLFGGGIIYAMGLLGDFLFKKESMGGGDVKLLAMIGAFIGWELTLLTFFLAPFFGAFYGIIEKIRIKDTAIAYGPFLALGAVLSLFWGDIIISRLFSGFVTF